MKSLLKNKRLNLLCALALAAHCSMSFGQEKVLETLDADLVLAYRQIRELSPDLVRGKKIPTWEDFNRLETIIKALSNGFSRVQAKGRLEELKAAIAEIEKTIPSDARLAELHQPKEDPKSNDYRPTEYELKLAYQSLLEQLNRELPESLRIEGVRLPADPRPARLLLQAQELVRELEKNFEILYPTSGYANESDLVAKTTEREPVLREVYVLSQVFQPNRS